MQPPLDEGGSWPAIVPAMQRAHRWLFALGLVAGCFSDSSSGGGGTGDLACPDGSSGCPCYGNGTCDVELTCQAELQLCFSESCVAGAQDCPCDDGECAAGLVCDAQVCQLPGGTSDTAGTGNSSNSPDTGSETTAGDDADTTVGDAADTTALDSSETATETAGECDPDAASALLLFASGQLQPSAAFPSANVRTTVDALCQAEQPAGCLGDAHAVFSTSSVDTVAVMDTNYCLPFDKPLVSTNGDVFADSFQGALGGGLSTALTPLFTTAGADVFWSSANGAGDYDGQNCNDWGVGGAVTGKSSAGVGSATDTGTWLFAGVSGCESPLPLLCVCGGDSL